MTYSDGKKAAPRLKIEAENTYVGRTDYDTKITLFSGRGAKMGEGEGRLSIKLPRGIYTIRTERFGEIGDDVVILHEKDASRTVPAPRRHSAMPSTDTSHTHEFLQAAGYHYSRNTTWANPQANAVDPLLMILVRATGDGDHSGHDPAENLRLIDAAGGTVTRFEPDRVQGHRGEGWVAFSALLAPGHYMLTQVQGAQAVFLPILLTRERWNTLVFVPVETQLRLSAVSIDMCRRDSGYNPDDPFTQQIDAAVQGLGMRLDLLAPDLRNDAIYGKFEHPFHGLIGAYAYFLGSRKSERLEHQVLRNLWRLLEGSPDAVALLLLAHERETGRFPPDTDALHALTANGFSLPTMENRLPLAFPPLLRASLDVLIRASADLPDLIAPGCWLEAAANSSYADGPWAVWRQENVLGLTESMPFGRTPQILSHQRVYPAIKRAIARDTQRDVRAISADDRLDDLSVTVPNILGSIAREMPEYQFHLGSVEIETSDRVRDLAHVLIDDAEPLDTLQAGLEPDVRTPDWLVGMVRDRVRADGSGYDPAAVARLAGVPLRSVLRAAELAGFAE